MPILTATCGTHADRQLPVAIESISFKSNAGVQRFHRDTPSLQNKLNGMILGWTPAIW